MSNDNFNPQRVLDALVKLSRVQPIEDDDFRREVMTAIGDLAITFKIKPSFDHFDGPVGLPPWQR